MNNTISLIALSQLVRFKRIDAEYYQPEYLRLHGKLQEMGAIRLGDKRYSKVTDGIHEAIDYDTQSGIRCLTAQSVRRGYLDLASNTYISKAHHESNLKTSLREGDVLLTSEGAQIGDSAIVTRNALPANTVRQVGIIRTTEALNPYYLCAFLNSRYGRFQSRRETTGNSQGHIFIDKMSEILVPLLANQESVGNKMRTGLSLIAQSEAKFEDAKKALLSQVGFADYRSTDELTYTASHDDIVESHRFDAEYFQPKYANLLERIHNSKYGFIALVSRAPLSRDRADPLSHPDDRFIYVELADVNGSFGIIDQISDVEGRNAPSRAQMVLKTGDVIVSAVVGSVDKVAMVTRDTNNSIGSTGFFVFRPKPELKSGYLLLLAKSPIVQMQVERENTGTVLASVPRSSAAKLVIPDVPTEAQDSISKAVDQSLNVRLEGLKLVSSAISEVEAALDTS